MDENDKIDTSAAVEVGNANFPKVPVMGQGTLAGFAFNDKAVRGSILFGEYNILHTLTLIPKENPTPARCATQRNFAYTLCSHAGRGEEFRGLGSVTFKQLGEKIAEFLNDASVWFTFTPPAPSGKYGNTTFYADEASAKLAFARMSSTSSGVATSVNLDD